MKQENLMREDAAEIGEDFMKALPEDSVWDCSPVECYTQALNCIHDLEGTLRELVRLKDLKDRLDMEGPTWTEYVAKKRDYDANKPKAWATARKLSSEITEK